VPVDSQSFLTRLSANSEDTGGAVRRERRLFGVIWNGMTRTKRGSIDILQILLLVSRGKLGKQVNTPRFPDCDPVCTLISLLLRVSAMV
jgi:hypothetical protein